MSLLLMAEAMIFLHVQKSLPLQKNVTNVIQREHLRQRTKTESSFRKNGLPNKLRNDISKTLNISF